MHQLEFVTNDRGIPYGRRYTSPDPLLLFCFTHLLVNE